MGILQNVMLVIKDDFSKSESGEIIMHIKDPEVRLLASIASTLAADYDEKELEWANSPFGWIRHHPSRVRGKIGGQLVAGWLAARDFNVARSTNVQADRLIEESAVEIKSSTLWKSGIYKFQQIRDQDYRYLLCLGISPFNAHCWFLPKDVVMRKWHEGDGILPQHSGATGSDTAWLSVNPEDVDEWLNEFGGALSAGLLVIRKYLRQRVV